MSEKITTNLPYLCENIGSLPVLIAQLQKEDIISTYEIQEIESQRTDFQKNSCLLNTIIKKDWKRTGPVFLNALRKSHNAHCADKIEGSEGKSDFTAKHEFRRFPDEDGDWRIVNSFLQRRIGCHLLIEQLKTELETTGDNKAINRKVVITGVGGIGKTSLAKSFAQAYEGNYQHLLWIDCSDGKLVTSFEKLSMIIGIKSDIGEGIPITSLVRKIYEELSDKNCLWFFDNVKDYDFIKDKLPDTKHKNFHSIITSRNRLWGDVNGLGKIEEIHLDVFNEADSVGLLKNALEKSIDYKDYELEELSKVLGGHPLALQLAVACINKNVTVTFEEYVSKLKSMSYEHCQKDCRNFLHENQFDAYPNSILKTVQTSFDFLEKEERGKLAVELVRIFAYVPYNNVKANFFETIFTNNDDINIALELLKAYSLVHLHPIKKGKRVNVYCSTQTLIQQVIRHNGQNFEAKTLKSLLNCEGFFEYKIIPYKIYADRYQSNNQEFALKLNNIRSELIRRINLSDLLAMQKFDEAVAFAEMIHLTTNSITSGYNLGICLCKDKRLKESKKYFEEINEHLNFGSNQKHEIKLRILETHEKPTKYETYLWLHYFRRKMGKSQEIIPKYVHENFNSLNNLKILGCELPIDLKIVARIKNVELHRTTIVWNAFIHEETDFIMEKFCLNRPTFLKEDGQILCDFQFRHLRFFMKNLEITGFSSSTIHVDVMKLPETLENLQLHDVTLIVPDKVTKEKPSVLSIKIQDPKNKNVRLTEFLSSCPNLVNLELFGYNLQLGNIPDSVKTLKLMDVEYLEGDKIKVSHLECLTLLGYFTVLNTKRLPRTVTTKNLVIELSQSSIDVNLEAINNLIESSKQAVIGVLKINSNSTDLSNNEVLSERDNSGYYLIKDGKPWECISEKEFHQLKTLLRHPNDEENVCKVEKVSVIKIPKTKLDAIARLYPTSRKLNKDGLLVIPTAKNPVDISDLLFSENGSIQYFKEMIDTTLSFEDLLIRVLCRAFGNFPVALVLAIATLNGRKMDLQTYITTLLVKSLENITDGDLTEYEKQLCRIIQISLDLIAKEKGGQLAIDILTIFAYIPSEDIMTEFFKSTMNISDREFEKSTQLLLKYSLVSKGIICLSKLDDNTETEKLLSAESSVVFSCLPPIQKIMRQLKKTTEKATVKKILEGEKCLEYKVMAFGKYADENLRNEFTVVGNQLLIRHHMIQEGCKKLKRKLDDKAKRLKGKLNLITNIVLEIQLAQQDIFLADPQDTHDLVRGDQKSKDRLESGQRKIDFLLDNVHSLHQYDEIYKATKYRSDTEIEKAKTNNLLEGMHTNSNYNNILEQNEFFEELSFLLRNADVDSRIAKLAQKSKLDEQIKMTNHKILKLEQKQKILANFFEQELEHAQQLITEMKIIYEKVKEEYSATKQLLLGQQFELVGELLSVLRLNHENIKHWFAESQMLLQDLEFGHVKKLVSEMKNESGKLQKELVSTAEEEIASTLTSKKDKEQEKQIEELSALAVKQMRKVFRSLHDTSSASKNLYLQGKFRSSLEPQISRSYGIQTTPRINLPPKMKNLTLNDGPKTTIDEQKPKEVTNIEIPASTTTLQEIDYLALATALQQPNHHTLNIKGFHIDMDKLKTVLAPCSHLQHISIELCTCTLGSEKRIDLPNLKSIKLEFHDLTLNNFYLLSEYANLNLKSFLFFYNQHVCRDWSIEKIWDLSVDISISINDVHLLNLSHSPCQFSASYISCFSDMVHSAPNKATTVALNRISNAELLTSNLPWQNSITHLILVAIDFVDFPNFISHFINVTFLSLSHSKRTKYDLHADLKQLKNLKTFLISSAEICIANAPKFDVSEHVEEIQFHECVFTTPFEVILIL